MSHNYDNSVNKILEREIMSPRPSLRVDEKEEEKEEKARGGRGPQSTNPHGVP